MRTVAAQTPIAKEPQAGLPGAARRIGLRVRVRGTRWRLDQELSQGWPSHSSPRHALRAAQLTNPATRRQLAGSLRQVVAAAAEPRSRLLSSTVPVLGDVVVSTSEALLGLAERLERPQRVEPRGMAGLVMLLSDGRGALYTSASERTVIEEIWRIADGLEPRR